MSAPAWKRALSSIKAESIVRRISQTPIIVAAARRGGSTLLADVIVSNRGIWYANEPFSVNPDRPGYELKRSLLPPREHSQYFALDKVEQAQFDKYLAGLFEARYSQLGKCKRAKFPYYTDRVCLKVLNTPWLVDWFVTETNAEVIFLTRHPAAQALSVLRQDWEFGVEAYFKRPDALAQHFDDSQIAFGHDVLKHGSLWQKAILDWIVINWVGLQSQEDDLIDVRYENLVLDPHSFVDEVLHNRLGLPEKERMYSVFEVPSNSSMLSTEGTRKAIIGGDRQQLISRWQADVDADAGKQAQQILDKFEISAYNMENSMPLN